MKFRILILIIFCSFICMSYSCTIKPYIEGGLSVYSQDWAEPDLRFKDPVLGYAELGLEKNDWELYIKHTSCPTTSSESGYGINEIGISKKVYLDDLYNKLFKENN